MYKLQQRGEGQSEVGSDGWGRIWDGYTNAPFNTGERGRRQDCRKNRETRRDTSAKCPPHQLSAGGGNIKCSSSHCPRRIRSPGDTRSQLLARDEAPPLSKEGTVALRCTGNTAFMT